MAQTERISRKKLKILTIIGVIISVCFWVDFIFDLLPTKDESASEKLIFAIIMTSLSIIAFIEVLRYNKDRKIYHYIAYILAIPLIPLFIIKFFSETKIIASLTLPFFVFGIITIVSTYSFKILELFELGPAFNNNVIPYLNLTTITLVFIYSDKFLIKTVAKFIPDNEMPKIIKDVTFELLDKKPFLKIAYILLTSLFIIATIEKLGEFEFFHFLDPYKNVALQSLITFAAIDRMLSKWKNNKTNTDGAMGNGSNTP
jgi:hypothetical protein